MKEIKFTGFKDCEDNDIYEGDKLLWIDVHLESDVNLEKAYQQVYWCKDTGAWMLDDTFKQDNTRGVLLSKELKNFKYKLV